MSKRINVNPDYYKGAGRERPGDGIPAPRGSSHYDDRARDRWERQEKERRQKQDAKRERQQSRVEAI